MLRLESHLAVLGLFLSIAAVEVRGAQAETFNYVITASGTADEIAFPRQAFTWTVTGSALETWSVTEFKQLSIGVDASVRGSNEMDSETKFFTAARAGRMTVSYELRGDNGYGQVELYLDDGEQKLRRNNQTGEFELDALAGRTYKFIARAVAGSPSGTGFASASTRYPGSVTSEQSAVVTSEFSAEGSVSALEGTKRLSAIPAAARPEPKNGGSLSPATYGVTDTSDTVETRIADNDVVAQTSYSETKRQPWSAVESGNSSVSSSDGAKVIAQSTLVAPNADTVWSVTDDNPRVDTWMDNSRLFARVAANNQAAFHSADFRDPRWEIDDTEINRVLSYWRAGAYHANAAGLDGFAPGSGPAGAQRHTADFREPFWQIDDTELNRTLAYWRAGGYHADPSGADGYAPGAAAASGQGSAGVSPTASTIHNSTSAFPNR